MVQLSIHHSAFLTKWTCSSREQAPGTGESNMFESQILEPRVLFSTFNPGANYPVTGLVIATVAGDFNGDAKTDFIVTRQQGISCFLNTGKGAYVLASNASSSRDP